MDDKNIDNSTSQFSISQYLTYIGPFLIFLGMTRLITFYNSFGVSITSYLELSEVLTSFFDILVFVVIFFAYTSIQNFLMGKKEDADIASKKRQTIVEEKNFFKICLHYLKYFSSLIIFGIVVILLCLVARFCFKWITTFTVFLYTGIFKHCYY